MKKIDIKNFMIICCASTMFFILSQILYGAGNVISTLIMSIAFFIFLTFIYDWKLQLFSINNYFVLAFFGIGCFYRYLIIGFQPDKAMPFAVNPLPSIPSYHTITALVILISAIFFAVGYRLSSPPKDNNLKTKLHNLNKRSKFNFKTLKIAYIIMLIFVYIYKLENLRNATQLNYGSFDNLFNVFLIFNQYVAYISLCRFIIQKDKKYLGLYLMYLIPEATLSIINAWKGPIMNEILILFIIRSVLIKKVNVKKYIIIMLFAFMIIFPIISMYRVNLQEYEYYPINFKSIVNYNLEKNIFSYVSERFSYYDEIYYVINVNEAKKDLFLDQTGLIHERFFSGLVPRIIYQEKRIVNTGLAITHYLMDYPTEFYNNLTISYIGDVWISYGVIGVVIINIALGWGIRKLENSRRNKFVSPAKYALLGYCLIGFIEGDIAAKLIGFLLAAIVVFLVDTFFELEPVAIDKKSSIKSNKYFGIIGE